jgi:hypothetical protein
MRTALIFLALLGSAAIALAQTARPSLAERSAQTEAVAKPYFEAYIARDWDRLEPMLDDKAVFDDVTAHLVFGAVGKQGKAVLMKAFRETYAAIRSMRFHPQSQFASLRFVRHLPAQRHGAARGADLRAGVGQTSGEETAGRATVFRSRCRALWG